MLKKTITMGLAMMLGVSMSLTALAQSGKDIVDTAAGAKDFSTLVAAVKAAGLVDTLKSDGPFTVFAPTNEAFGKLPKEVVADLLKPENKDKLTAILTYHVVPGKVLAKDVVGLTSAKSVQGSDIKISAKDGVMVNNANVVKTDIMCSNGVIHVIDTVIMPPAKEEAKDIVDTAVAAGSFKTLVAAVKAAGLVDTLKGDGPFTVFAPTDEAFAKIPKEVIADLLKPENKAQLTAILTYHVVPGKVLAKDVVKITEASTVQGGKVAVKVGDGGVMINGSKVVKTDIECGNGVIHVIDTVLMPPKKKSNDQSSVNPQRMIENAIATGAPLFNAGHHGECANVYTATMNQLMVSHGDTMPCTLRNQMTATLSQAQHSTNDSDRAWVLRRGLESVYTSMASMPTTVASQQTSK